jgi:glycosyltransferase involved in cell wall biosynthesis
MAKYLARLGWDVTVVTPHPSLWRNVENPQIVAAELEREGIRRILTGHQWRFLICSPNPFLICWDRGVGWLVGGIFRRMMRYLGIDDPGGIGWIRAAERACSTLTAKDVDVILASGSPFASFMLARRLSNRLGCPYVLDYRDPWMRNTRGRLLSQLKIVPEEIELVSGSSAVTVVSNSLLDGKLNIGSKLHVITNGFDPEEMAQVKPFDFGHFAIVYTGAFYIPERVITPVMRALGRLKETDIGKSIKWRFHYYGPENDYVRAGAAEFGLIDRVVLHGMVSRTEALSAVKGAGVAVVITSIFDDASREYKGIVTGKLFEPLGLGTPILLIAPPGSDARKIVEETGMGRGFVGTDIEGIVGFLSNIARTEYNIESTCTDRSSWPVLAAKLNRILRGVITGAVEDRRPTPSSA